MPLNDRAEAERLARAILDDITLDNAERVRATRDLTADLANEIEEGRALFRQRVDASLHGVFDEELLPWQGRARDKAIKYGGAGVDKTRALIAIGAGLALVAVIVWLVLHR